LPIPPKQGLTAPRPPLTEGTPGTKVGTAFWSFASLKSFPRSLLGAGCQPGASHAFAQAAFFQEILFQAAELPVEQVVGHFDQTHNHIGADDFRDGEWLGRPLSVVLVPLVLCSGMAFHPRANEV
jgi:hypothetical protein